MKDSENIKKELEELSPWLAQQKKEDGFTVPENYFEEMQQEVLGKLEHSTSNPNQEKAVAKSRSLPLRWLAVAASVALLLAAGFAYLSSSTSGSPQDALAEISAEEAATYIAQHLEDFDEDVLYELSAEDLIANEFIDIEAEDLDQYFEENEVDLEDLEIEDLF